MDSISYFFRYYVIKGVLCKFIERDTQNVVLKFREILPWRETSLGAHGMKSDEKSFLCQISAIFKEKIVHIVVDRYFSL